MYSYAADTQELPLPIVGIGTIIVGLPNMHSTRLKNIKNVTRCRDSRSVTKKAGKQGWDVT